MHPQEIWNGVNLLWTYLFLGVAGYGKSSTESTRFYMPVMHD